MNSPEYWNKLWSSSKRRYEKYSMQVAWEKIRSSKAHSVLDIGCGNGRLLYGVKDLDCFGVDISDVAIARMFKEYGIKGLAISAYDVDKLGRTFDFIVINHTLEHIQRDEELLIKCKSIMNPGAKIFIAVPNDISSPEETEEHVRKYDATSLSKLMIKVFGNCRTGFLHNHLFGESINENNI
jgi:2-polyprenyl-3-methyl-5-hydroxy-6-metoxy-1,4-benzoquinol methylase